MMTRVDMSAEGPRDKKERTTSKLRRPWAMRKDSIQEDSTGLTWSMNR